MHASRVPKHLKDTVVRKATRSEQAILNSVVPEEAVIQYPRIIQQERDPVVLGDKYLLASYVLFDADKSPDPDIKGVFMIRDTPLMNSADEAVAKAKEMVRTVDSLNTYYPIQIGAPYILSKSRRFVKNDTKVPIENRLRDETPTQPSIADINMEKMVDSLDHANLEVSTEQQREEKAQMDRIRLMRAKGDRMATEGTLENYTMLRHKYENILMNCRDLEKKRRLLDLMMKKAYQTRDEIIAIHTAHPDYEDKWVAEYQETLAQSGIKADVIRELADPDDFVKEENPIRITQAPPQ